MNKKVLMGLAISLFVASCKKEVEPTKVEQDSIVVAKDTLSEQVEKEEKEPENEVVEEKVVAKLSLSQIKKMAENDFSKRKSGLIQSGINFYNETNSYANEDPLSTEEVDATIVKIYTGDLSGDGLEDIVVWYDVRNVLVGRHPLESGVLLYRNTGDNIEFVKKHSGGGLDGYSNVEIRKGRVVLSYMMYRDSDPYCCPSKKETETVKL